MISKKNIKMNLSRDEEFQILKIILDKFLWLGTAGMGVGIYMILNPTHNLNVGLTILLTGAIIMFLFTATIMKNLHFQRKK